MLKNITLSAEESLLQKARQRASQEHKTLNLLFREWLARYAVRRGHSEEYRQLMRGLSHVRPGKTFSREELNER